MTATEASVCHWWVFPLLAKVLPQDHFFKQPHSSIWVALFFLSGLKEWKTECGVVTVIDPCSRSLAAVNHTFSLFRFIVNDIQPAMLFLILSLFTWFSDCFPSLSQTTARARLLSSVHRCQNWADEWPPPPSYLPAWLITFLVPTCELN